MNNTDHYQLINHAIEDLQQGNFAEGEHKLESAANSTERAVSVIALQVLIKSKICQSQYDMLLPLLEQLLKQNPVNDTFIRYVADTCIHERHNELVKSVCTVLCLYCSQEQAEILCNIAMSYSRIREYELAISYYQRALKQRDKNSEAIYVNMSVIYNELRNEKESKSCLKKALSLNPDSIPALFNLASHCEEHGDLEQAEDLFYKILRNDENNCSVLSRLVYLRKVTKENIQIVSILESIMLKKTLSLPERETVFYALGKAYDDLAEYGKAFDYYNQANSLSRARLPEYSKQNIEHLTQKIITTYSTVAPPPCQNCQSELLFICGMFRSGTTLAEQLLAFEPQLYAAGELTFVEQLVLQHFPDFPYGTVTEKQLALFRQDYMDKIQKFAMNAKYITNKMPDNFWYVGLLARAFPQAKFVFTDRHVLDICLSVYFQQLGAKLNYSSSITETAHYYMQYKKLQEHWQTVLPHMTFIFNYDEFICAPEVNARALLDFCGIEWQDECLRFHQLRNSVKTASVWQVRQPLFRSSSNRYKNYLQKLEPYAEYFKTLGIAY